MKIEKCLEEFYDYLEVEKNSSSETIRSYRNDFNGLLTFLKLQGVDEEMDAIATLNQNKRFGPNPDNFDF